MQIIGKKLSKEDFSRYIKDYHFGTLPAEKLVIHHTWEPTKAQWRGEATLLGIKKYYERKLWWAGPHLFVAEDGVWLFTPMRKNGIHAGKGNWRSIGIEIVGDYDHKKWEGKTKENALHIIHALQDRLDIPDNKIMFHRDYSTKTCPGSFITKEWLMQELERFRGNLYGDIPNWSNVAAGMSAKEVWLTAKHLKIISEQSKFTDPLTKGDLMIILKRLKLF